MKRALFVALLAVFVISTVWATTVLIPTPGKKDYAGLLKELDNLKVLASSADGEILAGAGSSGQVFYMNTRRPNSWRIFYEHGTEEVVDVYVSNDKYYVASVSENGLVRVWYTFEEPATRLFRTYKNTFEDAVSVAVSPADSQPARERLLAVASRAGRISLYNILGTIERPLRSFSSEIENFDLHFVLDGRYLVVFGENKMIVYGLDGTAVKELSFPANITVTTLLNRAIANRDMIMVGLEDGSIHSILFKLDGRELSVSSSNLGKFFGRPVRALAVSPYPRNQRIVFAASEIDIPVSTHTLKFSETTVIYNGYNPTYTRENRNVDEEDGVNVSPLGKRNINYIPVTEIVQHEVYYEYEGEEFSQELVLFAIDISAPESPKVLAFDYSWSKNTDWVYGPILSAAFEPLTQLYYDKFRTTTYTLDTREFYIFFGTTNEVVKVNFAWDSPAHVPAPGQYRLVKSEKFDWYGPEERVKKMKLSKDEKFLFVLDGGTTEETAGGIIKVWSLEGTPDRFGSRAPYIIYKTGREFELIDFTMITEFGLLFVTDGHEVIGLRASSYDAVYRGREEFVPYTRYTIPWDPDFGPDVKIIGIEVYRIDEAGKQPEYHLVAMLNNGKYLDAIIGYLTPNGYRPVTGYFTVRGRKVPTLIYDWALVPVAQEGKPTTLEPYIVSIDKDFNVRVWRIKGDEHVVTFYPGALVLDTDSLGIDPISGYVAIATVDTVKIYRLKDLLNQRTRAFAIIEEPNITAVAVAGTLVYLGRENGEFITYRIVGDSRLEKIAGRNFIAHEGYRIDKIIYGVRDPKYIFTSGADISIKIWKLE